MTTRNPVKHKTGAHIYGFHSNFEVLRVDQNIAKIVAINISPSELKIGDFVFFGTYGTFHMIDSIVSIKGDIITAKTHIHHGSF